MDTLAQGGELVTRPDDRPLRAGSSQVAREPPRVAAGHDRNAVAVEPLRQGLVAAPVLVKGAELASDQGPCPRATRLQEVGRRTVVANQWIGPDNQLSGIRGVGKDLLVSRQ